MGSGDRTPASSSAANAFTRCASRRSVAVVSPPLSQRARGLKEQRWVGAKRSRLGPTASEAERSPRNPQHARTCRRGARPRRRTRPRQPRATSRAAEAPPPVTQPEGRDRQAPPHPLRLVGALSPRRGKLAGCVCVYVCGVCFVIRTPADAAGMAARSGARRRGRGSAPGTPSYIRTRPTEAHVRARSPHAVHHAVRFSHASRVACGAAPHGVLRRGPSHSETQPHNREAHLRNKA